jgi:dimethylargininase
MIHGITSASLGHPDYTLALAQHSNYIEVLQQCGLEVQILGADSRFPDSTFVEDVALCTPACAIVTNPGAQSRKGEKEEIAEVLKSHFTHVESIIYPGTLEAGDVMKTGNHYYIGISERTNNQGADQLIRLLEKYDMTGSKIQLNEMLHLKTGISYLENGKLLVGGEFIHRADFDGFEKISVANEEIYASNSLWINDHVLVPAGFPDTLSKIREAGYKTIVLDVSEFQKLDGGLSCLSLRY